MDLQKISVPVAIIIGCAILGAAYYFVQVDKRKSIEAEQQAERIAEQEQRAYEREQQDLQNNRIELQAKQADCRALATGVRDRWSNVMGVTYSEWRDECMVTYTDTQTGETVSAPLSSMKDNAY